MDFEEEKEQNEERKVEEEAMHCELEGEWESAGVEAVERENVQDEELGEHVCRIHNIEDEKEGVVEEEGWEGKRIEVCESVRGDKVCEQVTQEQGGRGLSVGLSEGGIRENGEFFLCRWRDESEGVERRGGAFYCIICLFMSRG